MKKIFILYAVFFGYSVAFSQDKQPRLSVDFGYGYQDFSMNKLNEFYIDSFASRLQFGPIMENHINSGQQFRLGLTFTPSGMYDFGVYGSYQYGFSKSDQNIEFVNDGGDVVYSSQSTVQLNTNALGVGASATFYISHLLQFHKKENAWNRLHFGVEGSGGVGFSQVRFSWYDANFSSPPDIRSSTDFQGQIGVKTEYDFTKSPLITTLGIRLGYQYFRTKTLQDKSGMEWKVFPTNQAINLDFSGFYIGTYVKFGK